MKVLGIIPARYASTRFPGKPLAMLGDKTMICRVYEQALQSLDDVCVATDDSRIFESVQSFGGNVVMTSEAHRSGTDRCKEAVDRVGGSFDVIINIQGDEPFIHPSQISLLKECFEDPTVDIATLVKPFAPETPWDVLSDPNSPKVVVSPAMKALYFSRSVIPYLRGKEHTQWAVEQVYYKHIGLYGYRKDILDRITLLEPSPLETAESLEQLRWLENGYNIKVAVTHRETIGIDTPEDLEKALRFLQNNE